MCSGRCLPPSVDPLINLVGASRRRLGLAHIAAAPVRAAAFVCVLGLVGALSGTAATGAPVASATVNIKCSSAISWVGSLWGQQQERLALAHGG
jgi:hypothetical protein